ncbi:MAG: hypothetical protein HQ477_12460 [Chloroflexi bacterium]|nr:hypothetical protein [Chloroflexota bacterium]
MSNRSFNLVKTVSTGKILIALLIVFGLLNTFQSTALSKGGDPKPPKSAIVVQDKFAGPSSSLGVHQPKIDEVGGGWRVVTGDWHVEKGNAFDTLGYSAPYFTTINPSASNYEVAIDVTWLGASDAGLIFRHDDDKNYFSAVYDGKEFELRKTLDGVTQTLKKKNIKWERFETKTIEVSVDGSNIEAVVGKVKIHVIDTDLEFSRSVGAIVQRNDNDAFSSFEVKALGPPVTPPSITSPLIDVAVLFDAFDELTSSVALASHSPDKSAAASWSTHAGVWTVNGSDVIASTGGNSSDLRATIDHGEVDADIYTNLTWHSGLAGVVYRYGNESNWWMTFYDGHSLATISFSPEGFKVWDVTPFDWGPPGTSHSIRVRLNGYGVRIYADYDDLPKAVIVSNILVGETRAGLFNRHGNSNTFSEFVVSESPALPVIDSLPSPSQPPNAAVPPATPPDLELFDSFSDVPSQWNSVHEPDIAPLFRKWIVNQGRWISDFDHLTEVTGERTDQRAVIDTGVEDSLISSEFVWQSGRIGITFRYRDERNWAMVWYDGLGNLIFGKVVERKFTEIDRFPVNIKSGNSMKLDVWVKDNQASVQLGGKFIGSFDVSELPASTFAGMFNRNLQAAQFDNLSVDASEIQPNPGGVTFTPVVLDSFTESSPTTVNLPSHSPDLSPSTGWVEYSGNWIIENDKSRETFGFNADFRTAIPAVSGNQFVSTDIEYFGGRVGIVYRYKNESNWYMFWYDGFNIVLGKLVDWHFQVLQEQRFVWGAPGTERNLSVLVIDDEITAFVDGVDLLQVSGQTDLLEESKAGLFSRLAPSSTFDNFEVKAVTP